MGGAQLHSRKLCALLKRLVPVNCRPIDMQNMDANPLPNPDHDWTVVNFPGTLPLEGLVEDDEPEPAVAVTEDSPDLLRPFWSESLPPILAAAPAASELRSTSRLDSGSAARSRPVDVAQLVAAAEALQQENTQLRQQVERLESAVTECRAALELQQMRSQTQQSLYDARSRDLELACQEAQHLTTELAAARDALAQQGVERADWARQQQQAEGQIANLERSCALLQERCLRQSDQLNQSRHTVQDLRDRLDRQQRQTLQLRAALEQCLERDYRRGEAVVGISVLVDEPATDDHVVDDRVTEQGERATLTVPQPIAPSGAIEPVPPVPPAIVEASMERAESAEAAAPIAAAPETMPGTEAIRTEDILALLNWDLAPQADPSYRIAPTRSVSSQPAHQPQRDPQRAIKSPLDHLKALDHLDHSEDLSLNSPEDPDALDALAEALWLGDWPRPLAPTELLGVGDAEQDALAAHLDDQGLEAADLDDCDELEPEGVDLAPPLAELLSIEAELMDWPAQQPPTPPAVSSHWPAPTLSVPRKRRSSMAAVELPKW